MVYLVSGEAQVYYWDERKEGENPPADASAKTASDQTEPTMNGVMTSAFLSELEKIGGVKSWVKHVGAKAQGVLFKETPKVPTGVLRGRGGGPSSTSLPPIIKPRSERLRPPPPSGKWKRLRMARTGPTRAVSPSAVTQRLPMSRTRVGEKLKGHVAKVKPGKKFSRADIQSLLSEEGLERGASSLIDELNKIANGVVYKPPTARIRSRTKQTGGRLGESAFMAARRKMTGSQRHRVAGAIAKREALLQAKIKPTKGNPYEG